MDNLIKSVKHGKYTIEIFADGDAPNPMTDFDHVGVLGLYDTRGRLILSNHRNKAERDFEDFRQYVIDNREKMYMVFEVVNHDQTGHTFGLKCEKLTKAGLSDAIEENSSGVYFITKEEAKMQWPAITTMPDGSKVKRREMCDLAMRASLKTLSQYYEGDVYGFRITRKGADIEDGILSGCYGMEYTLQAAQEKIETDAMQRAAKSAGAKLEFRQDPKTYECAYLLKF